MSILSAHAFRRLGMHRSEATASMCGMMNMQTVVIVNWQWATIMELHGIRTSPGQVVHGGEWEWGMVILIFPMPFHILQGHATDRTCQDS